MHQGFCAITIITLLFICTAGCFSTPVATPVAQPPSTPTPTIIAAPTTENPVSTIRPSDMALQLTDIPADYILKDRSERIYPEISQLSRDLGWRQGYSVTFYRMNRQMFDMTGLRQSIDLYPILNMNKVFDMAKESMMSPAADGSFTVYELPLAKIGDASIAYKTEDTRVPYNSPVYTILFVKKDVFEKLEMGGTTTDYETLKTVARIAAEKIR